MSLKLSCSFAPGRNTAEHVRVAEQCGYRRAWFLDSPSMYHELWLTMGRAAERTERIGLAAGVTAPGLRSVTVLASALMSLAAIAPGRVACGIGVGGTAMTLLGKAPIRWAKLIDYVQTTRSLLRGEVAEWEGQQICLVPPNGSVDLPLDIPFIIAAEGPRGEATARDHGDGIFTIFHQPQASFSHSARLVFGTVIEPGEDPTGDRIFEAAGPGAVTTYHSLYAFGRRDDLAGLTGGVEFMRALDEVAEADRHTQLWQGQGVHLSDVDRRTVPREAVPELTLTGTAEEIQEKVRALEQSGITEIVYAPAGPDVEREIRSFAGAMKTI